MIMSDKRESVSGSVMSDVDADVIRNGKEKVDEDDTVKDSKTTDMVCDEETVESSNMSGNGESKTEEKFDIHSAYSMKNYTEKKADMMKDEEEIFSPSTVPYTPVIIDHLYKTICSIAYSLQPMPPSIPSTTLYSSSTDEVNADDCLDTKRKFQLSCHGIKIYDWKYALCSSLSIPASTLAHVILIADHNITSNSLPCGFCPALNRTSLMSIIYRRSLPSRKQFLITEDTTYLHTTTLHVYNFNTVTGNITSRQTIIKTETAKVDSVPVYCEKDQLVDLKNQCLKLEEEIYNSTQGCVKTILHSKFDTDGVYTVTYEVIEMQSIQTPRSIFAIEFSRHRINIGTTVVAILSIVMESWSHLLCALVSL